MPEIRIILIPFPFFVELFCLLANRSGALLRFWQTVQFHDNWGGQVMQNFQLMLRQESAVGDKVLVKALVD